MELQLNIGVAVARVTASSARSVRWGLFQPPGTAGSVRVPILDARALSVLLLHIVIRYEAVDPHPRSALVCVTMCKFDPQFRDASRLVMYPSSLVLFQHSPRLPKFAWRGEDR